MPPTQTIIYAVAFVFILVVLASIGDWFIANPIALVLMVAVIGGGIFAYRKAKQARNRV